jgi:hypothetical protein
LRSNPRSTPGDVKLHTSAGDGSYTESVIHGFDGTDGEDPNSVLDADGNLYGTTKQGDTSGSTLAGPLVLLLLRIPHPAHRNRANIFRTSHPPLLLKFAREHKTVIAITINRDARHLPSPLLRRRCAWIRRQSDRRAADPMRCRSKQGGREVPNGHN